MYGSWWRCFSPSWMESWVRRGCWDAGSYNTHQNYYKVCLYDLWIMTWTTTNTQFCGLSSLALDQKWQCTAWWCTEIAFVRSFSPWTGRIVVAMAWFHTRQMKRPEGDAVDSHHKYIILTYSDSESELSGPKWIPVDPRWQTWHTDIVPGQIVDQKHHPVLSKMKDGTRQESTLHTVHVWSWNPSTSRRMTLSQKCLRPWSTTITKPKLSSRPDQIRIQPKWVRHVCFGWP